MTRLFLCHFLPITRRMIPDGSVVIADQRPLDGCACGPVARRAAETTGSSRSQGRSPAARRRSRPSSRLPPAPAPGSVPGWLPTTGGHRLPACSSAAVLKSSVGVPARVEAESRLDEPLVEDRQPARSLPESRHLVCTPPKPSKTIPPRARGRLHPTDLGKYRVLSQILGSGAISEGSVPDVISGRHHLCL